MFFCVDLSLWFNQYVNPIAIDDIGWKFYVVYCCWLLFELLVVWKFYIETKETPLEEIAKHFDGDKAIIGGGAQSAKIRFLSGQEDPTTEIGNEKVGSSAVEIRE